MKNDLATYIQKCSDFCDREEERYKELSEKAKAEIDNLSEKCENIENQYKKLKSFQKSFLKRHTKAFTVISDVLCSLYDIDKQNIPTADQIMNDSTSISYFIGKVVTNVEKERIFYETKLKHIEGGLEKKKQNQNKKVMLLPDVVLYQSTIGDENIIPQTVY